MTRAALLAWLARRVPAPPEVLRAHLAAHVSDRDAALPDHLALEGGALLARVVADAAAGRDRALDLLAADAFVTYAFEAQAEVDVAGLPALAERLGRGELR